MADSINDEFGVRKIYPTNTHPNRAKPWLLGRGDWEGRMYNGRGDWDDYSISTYNNTVTLNFVNDPFIIHIGDIKGRFPVLALRRDQYPKDFEGNITIGSEKDQRKLRKSGYMGTLNDWKNVEITLYWKVNGITNSGNKAMAFSVRGGPHHSDGGLFGISPCWGTALYVGLVYSGHVGLNLSGKGYMKKELGHPKYTGGIYAEDGITDVDLSYRWIGMKGIFYTRANGNPYIELWLDKNVDNVWERILFKEDDGNWYLDDVNKPNECSGQDNEQVIWGGPGVIFKLDGLTRVDMNRASIREILPPEGWPLRYLLKVRGFSFPVSMRSLAEEYGLTAPISLRQLTELEAERYTVP